MSSSSSQGEQGECPAQGEGCCGAQCHVKVNAVDVLIRLREVSPAQQCRAMHDCARARAQGELDARSGAVAAAAAAAVELAAAAAAAGKAESPHKWT